MHRSLAQYSHHPPAVAQLLVYALPLLSKLSKKLKFHHTSAHSSIQPDSSGSDHTYPFPNLMTNQTEDHPLRRLSQTPGHTASTPALGRPAGPVTCAAATAAHAAGSSADADLAELAEFDEDLDVPVVQDVPRHLAVVTIPPAAASTSATIAPAANVTQAVTQPPCRPHIGLSFLACPFAGRPPLGWRGSRPL
ncbi:hypothetical protein BJV82DRAFT_584565 [Fennellomyces sp. T-0311]|nr:hypothetical protein BJV82DRAFT_584565 [Fennellomyces sp. T-0311]